MKKLLLFLLTSVLLISSLFAGESFFPAENTSFKTLNAAVFNYSITNYPENAIAAVDTNYNIPGAYKIFFARVENGVEVDSLKSWTPGYSFRKDQLVSFTLNCLNNSGSTSFPFVFTSVEDKNIEIPVHIWMFGADYIQQQGSTESGLKNFQVKLKQEFTGSGVPLYVQPGSGSYNEISHFSIYAFMPTQQEYPDLPSGDYYMNLSYSAVAGGENPRTQTSQAYFVLTIEEKSDTKYAYFTINDLTGGPMDLTALQKKNSFTDVAFIWYESNIAKSSIKSNQYPVIEYIPVNGRGETIDQFCFINNTDGSILPYELRINGTDSRTYKKDSGSSELMKFESQLNNLNLGARHTLSIQTLSSYSNKQLSSGFYTSYIKIALWSPT